MAFPDRWMSELLSKNDIVSIIGEYTRLTPRGGMLWACCPFHKEKTPSFKVDETRQTFYCFGCHVGGGVIQFVMLMQNASFVEAVQYLAERCGMEMPEHSDDAEVLKRREMRDRLIAACTDAAKFYYKNLTENDEAVGYLLNRKLTPNVIKRFGLGYSTEDRHALCDYLLKKGYNKDELISAGLAREYDGKLFDFFHGRIMFPIISRYGKVIAFGGRVMGKAPDGVGKYVNTSDTPIYNKRRELYGLSMCNKGSLPDLVIVEGYMDVISLHSAGVNNAVASLGTALTEQQALLMKRHTGKVYLCYDGDSAGIRATLRGIDILSSAGLVVRVISIPGGDDPDDYVKKFGAEGFFSLKDKSMTANEYKIVQLSADYDMKTVDGRQDYAVAACKLISQMQPVERSRYCKLVSEKTGFPLETLLAQTSSETPPAIGTVDNANRHAEFRHNREKKSLPSEREKYEYMLIACAAADKSACAIVKSIADELISIAELREFLQLICAEYGNGVENIDVARLLTKMSCDTSGIMTAINESAPTHPEKNARECIRALRKKLLRDMLFELSTQCDDGKITTAEYRVRFSELNARLTALERQEA